MTGILCPVFVPARYLLLTTSRFRFQNTAVFELQIPKHGNIFSAGDILLRFWGSWAKAYLEAAEKAAATSGKLARALDTIQAVRSRELVPTGARRLGNWGEARLENLLGGFGIKPKNAFRTSYGPRYIDRLVGGIAHEAKAGVNVRMTSPLWRQMLKDKELIDEGILIRCALAFLARRKARSVGCFGFFRYQFYGALICDLIYSKT